MPNITFNIKYNKDSDLILSPQEIREIYMWGVNVKDQNGSEIPDDVIRFYIRQAQDELEHFLNLKFKKQVIEEQLDFSVTNWKQWGYMRCTYPVVCPLKLDGFLNKVKQIVYPPEWLTARKTSDGILYHRNLYIVPAGDAVTNSNAVIYSGIIPQLGFIGAKSIPNYWTTRYVTGFEEIPKDIVGIIGRTAAIQVFHIAGDLILGAGIASFSLGIDGLSQSISTTSSATNAGYGARILGYVNDLKRELPNAKNYYRGFSFGVC